MFLLQETKDKRKRIPLDIFMILQKTVQLHSPFQLQDVFLCALQKPTETKEGKILGTVSAWEFIMEVVR